MAKVLLSSEGDLADKNLLKFVKGVPKVMSIFHRVTFQYFWGDTLCILQQCKFALLLALKLLDRLTIFKCPLLTRKLSTKLVETGRSDRIAEGYWALYTKHTSANGTHYYSVYSWII